MLKTFQDQNHLEIMRQALVISSFEKVRDTFLAAVSVSTDFTVDQKIAIRLAGAKLNYHGPSPGSVDMLLMQILRVTWQDLGLGEDVVSLVDAQREGVIEAIMQICRGIINEEVTRLGAVAAMVTSLPADWNQPDPIVEDTTTQDTIVEDTTTQDTTTEYPPPYSE